MKAGLLDGHHRISRAQIMKSLCVSSSPASIDALPISVGALWRVRVLALCCASVLTGLTLPGMALGETLIQNRSWEYPDASGALGKEVDEPDNPQLCAIPGEYFRDGYGNVTEVVKRACGGGGAPEAWMPSTPYRSTTSVYADPRLPTSVKNAKGHTDTYTYDAYGRILTQTSANGLVTTFGYDSVGRLISVRRPDGNKTQFSYFLCTSDTVGASDPTSAVCLNQYTTSPEGVQVKFFTMKEELPVNASGVQNGPRVRYFYDALARQVSKVTDGFSGKGINEDTIYDALGRLVHKNRPYYGSVDTPQWTKYTYDELDRLTLESRPDGGATSIEFNVWGAGTSMFRTESVGVGKPVQTTKEFKNYRGDVVQINDAAGAITTFSLDAFANVLSIRTPNTAKGSSSEQRSYLVRGAGSQYDTRGRVRWTSDISRGQRAMQYNAHGDLARVLDTATSTTARAEYTYDAIGRVTKRTEADLVSQWYYDTNADGTNCSTGAASTKGWLCEATTDNGFDEKYAYDTLGNPSRTTRGALQVNTTYNTDGRPADRTYPSGFKLVFGYQPTYGYLSSLKDGGTGTALVTLGQRDAEMHALSYTLGTTSPVAVGAYYEAKTGRPYQFAAVGSSSLQEQTLTWDWVGNLTSSSDSKTGVLANYEYDALNRLTKESRSGWGFAAGATPVFTWTYQPSGNIASTTNTFGTLTYNYVSTGIPVPIIGHQVASLTGTINGQTNPSFTYDPRGNMLSGLGRTYTWNSFDMPVTVTKGTAQLAYLYGPDHQRTQEKYSVGGALQRTTTYFTPSGMTTPLYEEEVQGGTITKKAYVQLDGQPIAVVQHVNGVRDTKFLLKDHLGSVNVAVKADGTLGDRQSYEPFGRRRYADGTTDTSGTITSTQTDRGYTGHEMLDEVGVIHMNGRLYDPWIQRFVSADPVITNPNNPQDYNRYSYVRNNPMANTDPTGFEYWAKTTNADGVTINTQSWTNGRTAAWNSYTGDRASCMSCAKSSAGPVADRNITFNKNGTASYRTSSWVALAGLSVAVPVAGSLSAPAVLGIGLLGLGAIAIDSKLGPMLSENARGNGDGNGKRQAEQKSGVNTATGGASPPPDDDDSNKPELTREEKKAIKSYEKRIAEHEKKLAEFKTNPTVRPGMEGQPQEVIERQQAVRVQHLEGEIRTFRANIDKIMNGR